MPNTQANMQNLYVIAKWCRRMSELKWLEDLLALVETGSVTKAAEQRHVTQPAFSRRIRQLEQWLGMAVIDRSRKPVQVYPLIVEQEGRIRELVRGVYQLRNQLQDNFQQQRSLFVVQHTLAVSHFSRLLKQLKDELPYPAYRLYTANNEACPALFHCDAHFMLCYEQPDKPILDTSATIHRQALEMDSLLPVATTVLLEDLSATLEEGERPVLPVLMYLQDSFFAEVISRNLLAGLLQRFQLNIICESALAVSLKEMALASMGVAWLPRSLVREEIDDGRLCIVDWLEPISLQISLYRHSTTTPAPTQ